MENSSQWPVDDQVLDYDGLSERLKVPKRTLKRYVQKGEIPCSRIGKRVRFYWPRIVEWLREDKGAGR